MRKLYLASGSKARRELLKSFGFKFKVLVTKVKELRQAKNISYAELVKINALRKVQEAAASVKSGVIISADTIMVQDGKIYGKPRDLSAARRMLKNLSSRPQWVYTGLAVIDKDNQKVKVSYEKTKVYMDKLDNKQIDAYFKQVSPLDKAGSFDIQGKGAFFIRRIEGCYYNVVGLPMRKLFRMLNEMNIGVLLVACALVTSLSGCSTEYNMVTGEEETYYYSTDKEVKMGESISKQVESEYPPVEDLLIQQRVQEIGKKIAAVCDRKEVGYHFKVLKNDEINAFALPGGFIYVNSGLLIKTSGDDEVAAVLAHEVGHIVARHSIKKLQGVMGYSLARILMVVVPQAGEVGATADAVFTEIILGYGREDELLADRLGARYAKLAGYNPRAMISFLEKLQETNRYKPLAPKSYFKTHPYVPDRIREVKLELGEKLDFSDYVNIEQKPHK